MTSSRRPPRLTTSDRAFLRLQAYLLDMVGLSDWLDRIGVSPVVLVVAVLFGTAILTALVIDGLPSRRVAVPSAVAVFVFALIVLDLRRRD